MSKRSVSPNPSILVTPPLQTLECHDIKAEELFDADDASMTDGSGPDTEFTDGGIATGFWCTQSLIELGDLLNIAESANVSEYEEVRRLMGDQGPLPDDLFSRTRELIGKHR